MPTTHTLTALQRRSRASKISGSSFPAFHHQHAPSAPLPLGPRLGTALPLHYICGTPTTFPLRHSSSVAASVAPPPIPNVKITMGGCATKPKEPNGHLPADDPSGPEVLAKSVDISAAPIAPAGEVKTEADGGADKETGGEATAEGSEPKLEAEPKVEPAAESSEEAKEGPPKLDAAEASKDAAEGASTEQKEAAAAAAASDAAVPKKTSADEATDHEAEKPGVQPVEKLQETKAAAEGSSPKDGTPAASSSTSAS